MTVAVTFTAVLIVSKECQRGGNPSITGLLIQLLRNSCATLDIPRSHVHKTMHRRLHADMYGCYEDKEPKKNGEEK